MLGRDDAQLWDWIDDDPIAEAAPVDASSVTAILVAHNGAEWLPQALSALSKLDARPGALIAVDAESVDESRQLLDQAVEAGVLDQVISGRGDQGFGANVEIGLAAADVEPDWLWLLHDDLMPAPDSLSQLLRAAEAHAAEILTPKLLYPKRRNHPDQVSALGETIARTGRQVPGADVGDVDQKQLDSARVLGASSAGLLIAMPTWRRLNGFDPLLPLFRDGVDFGWRANELGIAVQAVPEASMRHVSAGRVGRRTSTLAPDPELMDRLAGMTTVVLHSPKPARTRRRLGFESWGRAAGLLMGKSPQRAAQTIKASRQLSANAAALDAAAQRNLQAASATLPAGLMPGLGWGLRHWVDRTAGSTVDRVRDFTEADDSTGMIDELTGDDFAATGKQSRWTSPVLIGALVMLVLSLVAARRMFGAGQLLGPQLLPAPADLSAAWQLWAMHNAGMPGANPPWLGLMALGSTITAGSPQWFVSVIILGGIALAAWSAHHFAWRLVGRNWLAAVLAALWGLTFPLVGAISAGALDAIFVAIVLPLLGSALHGWWRSPISGAEGLRRPAAAGLWTAILASFLPLFYLIGTAAALAVGVGRKDRRGALLAALIPPVLLAPWLPRLADAPARILVGYEPAASWASEPLPAVAAWLGRSSSTTTPLWLSVIAVVALWLLAVISLLRSANLQGNQRANGQHTRGVQLTLLGGAIAAPLIGALLSKFVLQLWSIPVRPDPTCWSLLGMFCLFVLICHGIGMPARITADATAQDVAQFDRRTVWRSRCAVAIVALTSLLAGWWVIGGVNSPLHRQTGQLPSHVVALQNSERSTHTLMVDLTGQERYALVSARRPVWGSGERPAISADPLLNEEVLSLAQQVVQGVLADDASQRLQALGIGHIWVRGASEEAIYELGAAADLSPAQVDSNTTLFTVDGAASRFQLRRGDSVQAITIANAPALQSGDEILLAEPADRRWKLTLDGAELPADRAEDGRQRWTVDRVGSELKFSQRVDWASIIPQLLGFLVVVVLMAPVAATKSQPKRALGGSSAVGRQGLTKRDEP